MSESKKININVELNDDYQEGVEDISAVFEMNRQNLAQAHLYTKEELVEVFLAFNDAMEHIFFAGLMVLETEALIQDVEGTQN